MEFKRAAELRQLADLKLVPPRPMTRREKVARWAALLESEPQRRLRTLDEIDLQPAAARPAMRADDSALAVAFADPVLRAQGLSSDRLGDGMRFFEISEDDAHFMLCSCLNGRTMEARRAAQRLRMVTDGSRTLVRAGVVAAVLAVPMVLYLF